MARVSAPCKENRFLFIFVIAPSLRWHVGCAGQATRETDFPGLGPGFRLQAHAGLAGMKMAQN